jgi:hypothetical protein
MKYIILILPLLLAQGCATNADKRRELGTELCKEVYGHAFNIAVRQVEGNQILVYCGN